MKFPLLCACLTVATPAFAAPLVKRTDVATSFGAVACAETPDERPLAAWAAGVFDAQMDGRRAALRAGRAPTMAELERKARAIARVRHFAGYAAGSCPDGSGWAVALPSAEPLKVDAKTGALHLPASLIDACASFRVDFAPTDGFTTKQLGAARTVAAKDLGDGVLGVSCQPPRPRTQGPVLWFLAPVGKGPSEIVPESAAFGGGGTTLQRLESWILAVRRAAGAQPVVFKREMNEEASILAINPSLNHDRELLKKVGESLDAGEIKLLGENRVKGRDPERMAWLLWNSPRHRELLLNGSATVAGLAARDDRGETLVVLVLGQDQPLKTAKGTTKKRKG